LLPRDCNSAGEGTVAAGGGAGDPNHHDHNYHDPNHHHHDPNHHHHDPNHHNHHDPNHHNHHNPNHHNHHNHNHHDPATTHHTTTPNRLCSAHSCINDAGFANLA
jgi:hypothetical protein